MAVTFDTNTSSDVDGGASPLTWTHTGTGSTDRAVAVSLGFDVVLGMAITDVTYDSTAMTYAEQQPASGNRRGRQYVLATNDKAAGSHTVSVSYTGTAVGTAFGAASYAGVDQTTPIRSGSATSASGSDDAPTVAVTSQADDLAIDMVYHAAVTETAGGGQTERIDVANGGNQLSVSDEAGAASVTMSWSLSAASNCVLCALSVAAAGGAPAAVLRSHRMLLLGVG